MARQSFLSGGFEGKLGKMVGWHAYGQFYAREWVRGKHPNTPGQKLTHDTFALANRLAQEAMNVNGHTGIWAGHGKNEYSSRVGQAYRHLREGWSEAAAFPLYPDGVPFPFTVTFTGVTYNTDGTITVGISGFTATSAREVSIEYGWDLFPGVGPQVFDVPLTLQPGATSITIPALPNNIIGGDISLRGANTDHPGNLSYIIDFTAFTFAHTGSNFTPAWYKVINTSTVFNVLYFQIAPEGTTANKATLTGINLSLNWKGSTANTNMTRYSVGYDSSLDMYGLRTSQGNNDLPNMYMTMSGYADNRNADGFLILRFVSQWNL